MYSIADVIYGIPITDKISELANKREEELDVDDGGWFHCLYHGGSYREVGYLGVTLASFDECSDFKLETIIKEPTEEQAAEVLKAFNALPIEYREIAPDIAVWVVFSTS
jgi:hypothetical protein